MKKDYFKDGESPSDFFLQGNAWRSTAVDSIFAEWQTQIRKSKDESLNRSFYQLQDSFARFKVELIKKGYKGYFSND